MKRILCAILSIICLVGILPVYGAPISTTIGESKYAAPLYYPPSNTHPRVYFTADKIDDIKANIEAEENAIANSSLETYINRALSESENYSYNSSDLATIEANAFYYAIYGDTEAGAKAIKGITFIKDKALPAIDKSEGDAKTRPAGRCINVLAEVYDWCYDLMDDARRTEIIALYEKLGALMEMGYPPSKQGAVTGHGSETQLLRDHLSFAIAAYDESPELWEYIGGRFYEQFVPARVFADAGHWYHQGIDYGMTRAYSTACAYALITGMGLPEPWSKENMAKSAYTEIYSRRPDGYFLQDGDVYTNSQNLMNGNSTGIYVNNSDNGLFLKASLGDNPYVKDEMFRTDFSASTNKLSQSFRDSSPVLYLITSKPSLEAKSRENLPLSNYFPSPMGIMAARTGWEEGEQSNSVVATMKIGEYYFANHQHNDFGSFQIYYKGILAGEGGNYTYYGNEEHFMYTVKSIAHNTILVHDPDEYTPTYNQDNTVKPVRNATNDGGQRFGGNEVYTIDKITDDPSRKFGEVLAREIDPKNIYEPDYTYIKGDITNAYSDKIEGFKRSMMFLNLKDSEIPAAMIVFDKVNSSDATFKKTWLLNGVVSPKISGNTAVFENTLKKGSFQYGGKLEVKTLLPSADNLSSVVRGGPGHYGEVYDYEYNEATGTWDETLQGTYTTDEAMLTEGNERNTYRLELSPKTANKEDYFLNVMTVGDAGENISVSAPLIDADGFYGTVVSDRAVFFGKGTENNESFTADVPVGSYKYTVCDMAKGKYNVSVGGSVQTVYASEDGGVLSFSGTGGQVIITKVDDTYVAPVSEAAPAETEARYVRYNNGFINVKTDGAALEEETMASVSDIAKELGYRVEKGEASFNIYSGIEKLATLTAGKSKAQTSYGTMTLSAEPVEINGELFVRFSDLCSLLSRKALYVPYLSTRFLYDEGIVSENLYATGYIKEGKLYINAKLKKSNSAQLILGIKQDNVLKKGISLTSIGDGCYSGEIDVSDIDGDYEAVIYSWGDDLYPMISAKNFEFQEGYEGVYTPADESLNISSRVLSGSSPKQYHFTIVNDGSKYTLKRGLYNYSELSAETTVAPIKKTEGILHYSANLIVNKVFGEKEYLQFRLRWDNDYDKENGLTADTVRYMRNLSTFDGAEHKLDCIADLDAKTVYIYDNGELVDEYTPEADGDRRIDIWSGFEYYDINPSEAGESQFMIFDPSVVYYEKGTDVEIVKAKLGKFNIYK